MSNTWYIKESLDCSTEEATQLFQEAYKKHIEKGTDLDY